MGLSSNLRVTALWLAAFKYPLFSGFHAGRRFCSAVAAQAFVRASQKLVGFLARFRVGFAHALMPFFLLYLQPLPGRVLVGFCA
jgi:hypothetical protein